MVPSNGSVCGDVTHSGLVTTLVTITGLAAVLGCGANILLLTAYWLCGHCQAPRHTFVAAMAALDLLHNLVAKGLMVVVGLWHPEWAEQWAVAYLGAGFQWVCRIGSLCQLVFLAANHLLLVKYGPHVMVKVFNRAVNKLLVGLSCLIPSLFYILPTSPMTLAFCSPPLMSLPSSVSTATVYVQTDGATSLLLTILLIGMYACILKGLRHFCISQSHSGRHHIAVHHTQVAIIRLCAIRFLLAVPSSLVNIIDPLYHLPEVTVFHLVAFHLQLFLSSINVFLLPLGLYEFKAATLALMFCHNPAHNPVNVLFDIQLSLTTIAHANIWEEESNEEEQQDTRPLDNDILNSNM